MLVVKLSAEAQIEEWLSPNLRLTNSPSSTLPTLVRIMFSKAVSVGMLASTYRHVSPLTWLYSQISKTEKSYVNYSHPTFTTIPRDSSQASFIITIASRLHALVGLVRTMELVLHITRKIAMCAHVPWDTQGNIVKQVAIVASR